MTAHRAQNRPYAIRNIALAMALLFIWDFPFLQLDEWNFYPVLYHLLVGNNTSDFGHSSADDTAVFI